MQNNQTIKWRCARMVNIMGNEQFHNPNNQNDKRTIRLQILSKVAFAFGSVPVLLFLIRVFVKSSPLVDSANNVFFEAYFTTFAAISGLIGIILGTAAIASDVKRISNLDYILSRNAIILPVIWLCAIILLGTLARFS